MWTLGISCGWGWMFSLGNGTLCQAMGAAACRAGLQGILSPSATGVGAVLAVYVDRLDQGTGFGEPREAGEWPAVDLG